MDAFLKKGKGQVKKKEESSKEIEPDRNFNVKIVPKNWKSGQNIKIPSTYHKF